MKKHEIYFNGSLSLANCIFKPDMALTKYIVNIIEGMIARFDITDHQDVTLQIRASRKPTWLGRPESGKFKICVVRTDLKKHTILVNDKFYSDEL